MKTIVESARTMMINKELWPKSRKRMFVGYSGYYSNYGLSNFKKRKIKISFNANFNEWETIGPEKKLYNLENLKRIKKTIMVLSQKTINKKLLKTYWQCHSEIDSDISIDIYKS